jgi:hypothetical protein
MSIVVLTTGPHNVAPHSDPTTSRQKRRRLLDQHRLVWAGNIAGYLRPFKTYTHYNLFILWYTFVSVCRNS